MTIGYVRVSSNDQNEERQVQKMKSLGVEDRFLFIDKASGKNFDRPKYQAMKVALRPGDLLYIDSIDRLGRNYEQVKEEWKYLTRNLEIDVVALDMQDLFDSRKFRAQGDVGKLLEDQMLSLLAWVAEQERNKIRSRQKEGIAIAKAQGKYKGRKEKEYDKKLFHELYVAWKNGETQPKYMKKKLGMSHNTFYRRVKDYEIEHGIRPKDEVEEK